jgi:hypothetical protein
VARRKGRIVKGWVQEGVGSAGCHIAFAWLVAGPKQGSVPQQVCIPFPVNLITWSHGDPTPVTTLSGGGRSILPPTRLSRPVLPEMMTWILTLNLLGV